MITDRPLFRLTLFRLGRASFRLVWTFHHALLDGRSILLVVREVLAIYAALRQKKELELPQPRSYCEFIKWLGKRNLDAAKDFWRDRLEGFVAPTPLPFESIAERPGGGLFGHGEEHFHLSASGTTALQSMAREQQVTLNTLLQGAWALLLSRYSGRGEVLFGATRACRHSSIEGAESIVGVFINTLPVRVEIAPEMELVPWLKRLRSQWNALRDFEHTPLVKVQGWSDVPGASPLFASLVVYESFGLNEALRAEEGASSMRAFHLLEQPGYPLTLTASGGPELHLRILYERARYDAATIRRILQHLAQLLSAMCTSPPGRLGELSMLGEEERQQLLVDWNTPVKNFSPEACLHQLFARQAERTPDAIAVAGENGSLTYAELDRRSDQLAYELQRRRVGPDTLVGVCLERTPDLIVTILGVLKAGGAYLPIDPACPAERLGFMLQDSGARILITQDQLADKLRGQPGKVLRIDSLNTAGPGRAHNRPRENRTSPHHLAYVIYTSGSTGKPKGVMVTHHNVVRLFQATHDWFKFSPQDVWTLFHSVAFDFSVWEIWGALVYGGKLILVPQLITRSPEIFYELVARERVTILNQTPSSFRQFIQAEEELQTKGRLREEPLALRHVILGGEALDPQTLRPWFARHGDLYPEIVNMYGITETTVHVTYRPMRSADVNRGSVIGVPIPDLQFYILDERRQPVPIGVPGEIYVGGAGVARGYLHRPELTAERFVSSPFHGEPARLYRTGDRARFLAERDVEYLGRVDEQMKIRGYRVEPGEIEAALVQHPLIAEAVVVCRRYHATDQRLIAYVLTRGTTVDMEEVRGFLTGRLPDYMVPAAIVRLERFPLTLNGKVDRAALPAPPEARADQGRRFVAPKTKLERTLAELWQELLGVKQVGLHDNFFEMGGHSLLIVQLHYRLQAVLKREVPITVLFQHPTINALTRHLSEAPAGSSSRKLQDRLERIRRLHELSA